MDNKNEVPLESNILEDFDLRCKESVENAMQQACVKYQQERQKAEKKINQGARLTSHQIKL